jgi:hypothetical protein
MKPLSSFLWLLLLLFVIACGKKSGTPEPLLSIQGFALKDALGNPMGQAGAPDNDWKIMDWNQLTAREQSFLSFPDTINMSGTVVTTLTDAVAFPNPVNLLSSVQFGTQGPVKLKIAIVDSVGHLLRTHAVKLNTGYQVIYFDVSDETLYRSGLSLRYYYSFSAAAQANFKAGYGDVKICRLPGGAPVMQCF